MRLGLYRAVLEEGTLVRELYGKASVEERHRHRYEVNNAYRDVLEKAGVVFSGLSPDGRLVEFADAGLRGLLAWYVFGPDPNAGLELLAKEVAPRLIAGLA